MKIYYKIEYSDFTATCEDDTNSIMKAVEEHNDNFMFYYSESYYDRIKEYCIAIYESALDGFKNSPSASKKRWNSFLDFMYENFDEIGECGFTPPIKTYDDGINYNAPNESGLYFIGETHFNPFNDEKFYCVKIGKATNLAKRMKQYDTHNPMLWRIDFAVGAEALEGHYHNLLAQIAEARCNHNEEWFFVNRMTYFKMCKQGFHFFDK